MKFNRRTYTEVTRFAGELIDGLNIFIKGNVNFQYNLKKKKNYRSAYVSGFVFLELVSFNTNKTNLIRNCARQIEQIGLSSLGLFDCNV